MPLLANDQDLAYFERIVGAQNIVTPQLAAQNRSLADSSPFGVNPSALALLGGLVPSARGERVVGRARRGAEEVGVRRVATPLALAIVTAVAAVLLLLAAFDVQRWNERVAEDDVRFGTSSAAADLWKPATLLPGDPVERMLGVGDDLRYRDAVQSFFASHPREPAFQHPELEAARVDAQVDARGGRGGDELERRSS